MLPHRVAEQTLRRGLVESACQRDDARVDLDARNDSLLPEHIDERHASRRLLVQRLVEEDDTRDELVHRRVAREQNFAVLATVLFYVLEAEFLQAARHAP